MHYGKVDPVTNSVKFPLSRPCNAGEQCFLTYGNFSSSHLLTFYGFLPQKQNPYEVIPLGKTTTSLFLLVTFQKTCICTCCSFWIELNINLRSHINFSSITKLKSLILFFTLQILILPKMKIARMEIACVIGILTCWGVPGSQRTMGFSIMVCPLHC